MQISDLDNQRGVSGIAIPIAQGKKELVLSITMHIFGLIVVLAGFKVQRQFAIGGIQGQLAAIGYLDVGMVVVGEDAVLLLIVEVGVAIMGQAIDPLPLDRWAGEIPCNWPGTDSVRVLMRSASFSTLMAVPS